MNQKKRANQNEKSETYQRGLAARKKVLGEEYVDNALRSADAFSRDLQDYLTEHAWGASWAREGGLDFRTRSMINLAMISALNRPHELKLHVAGALNNGVTREEIREVLLQVSAYCGWPAAIDGFRIAREVFAERDKTAAP